MSEDMWAGLGAGGVAVVAASILARLRGLHGLIVGATKLLENGLEQLDEMLIGAKRRNRSTLLREALLRHELEKLGIPIPGSTEDLERGQGMVGHVVENDVSGVLHMFPDDAPLAQRKQWAASMRKVADRLVSTDEQRGERPVIDRRSESVRRGGHDR